MERGLSPEAARRRAQREGFSPAATQRAAALAVASPDSAAWRRFITTVSLALAAGLFASGIVTFFAFNWAAIGRFGRFGVLQFLLVAAVAAAARWWSRLGGQIALTLGAVLVGVLLAVFGQTYQTGADPYELFLGWAALIAPWVLLARFEALWLLGTVVLQVGLGLWWRQRFGDDEPTRLLLGMWAVNVVLVVTWEWQAARPEPWMVRRWLPRAWALLAAAPLGILAVYAIVDVEEGRLALMALALGVSIGLVWWRYRGARLDLFVQTLVLGVLVTALTTTIGRLILHNADAGGLLFMALVIPAQIAAVVMWLRREARAARGGAP